MRRSGAISTGQTREEENTRFGFGAQCGGETGSSALEENAPGYRPRPYVYGPGSPVPGGPQGRGPAAGSASSRGGSGKKPLVRAAYAAKPGRSAMCRSSSRLPLPAISR